MPNMQTLRVILDTNVLVAGLKLRRGASFKLLTLIDCLGTSGHIKTFATALANARPRKPCGLKSLRNHGKSEITPS